MYDTEKAHYVVVTVMVYHENKYLILKRSPHEKAFPNLWTVPGGKLERNDYMQRPKDTLSHWYNVFEDVGKRELAEETGLTVNHFGYLTSMVYMRSDTIPCIIVSLFAVVNKTDVVINQKDHTEYAWVTFDELKNYELVDGLYEEFIMMEEQRKGKPTGVLTRDSTL